MKSAKRISLLLALALTLTFLASCAEKADDTPEQTDIETESEEAESVEERDKNLPADLDFKDASVRIINQNYFSADYYTFNSEAENGDVVNDAVYKRNQKVSEDLGVKFEMYNTTNHDVGAEDTFTLINNFVAANDDEYEFIHGVQFAIAQYVTKNLFVNLNDLPYINIEDDWWATNYIREATLGSTYYMLTGDITLGHIRHTSCIYFNKSVYESYFGDPNDFYQLVYDGKWTLDDMAKKVAGCYNDLNGNGKADNDDAYGMGTITSNLVDHFTYDAGVRVTTKDDEGIPTLSLNNERTFSFYEKLYDLYFRNDGVRIYDPTEETNSVTLVNKLQNGEVLLLLGWLYTADYLRNMETPFGVIPFPKMDEMQETYLTLPHDISNVITIPITSQNTEMTAAVLEALAYEGYKSVAPAYYNIAFKVKYLRDSDEISNRIIDMIHDNPTTDFAYIYNYALNNVGLIMREMMQGQTKNFSSTIAKKESSYTKKLNKFVEQFQEFTGQ